MADQKMEMLFHLGETGVDEVSAKLKQLYSQGLNAAEALKQLGLSVDQVAGSRSKEADAEERAQRRIMSAWDSAIREDQRRTKSAEDESAKRIAALEREAQEEQRQANTIFQARMRQWQQQQRIREQQRREEDQAQQRQSQGARQLLSVGAREIGVGGPGTTAIAGGLSGAIPLGLGVGVAAVGAFAGIASMTRDAAQSAQQLQNLADEFGISTSKAFQFQAAARLTGQDLGTLSQAARRLSVAIEEPGGAGKKTAEALAGMGISIRDGLGNALDQVFQKLSAIHDPAQRAAEAVAIFGRDGARMGLIANALNDVGVSMDENLTKQLVQANRQLEELHNRWTVLAAQLSAGIVIPIVTSLTTNGGVASGGKSGETGILGGLGQFLADPLSGRGAAALFGGMSGFFSQPPPPNPQNRPGGGAMTQAYDIGKVNAVLNDSSKLGIQQKLQEARQELATAQEQFNVDRRTGVSASTVNAEADQVLALRRRVESLQAQEKKSTGSIDNYASSAARLLEQSQNKDLGAVGAAINRRNQFIREYEATPHAADAARTANLAFRTELGLTPQGNVPTGQGIIGENAMKAARSAMEEARRNEESGVPTWGYQIGLGLNPITSASGKELGANWDLPEMRLYSERLRSSTKDDDHQQQTLDRLLRGGNKDDIGYAARQAQLETSLRNTRGNSSPDADYTSAVALAQKEAQIRLDGVDKLTTKEEQLSELFEARDQLFEKMDEARIRRTEEMAQMAQQQKEETGQFVSGLASAAISGRPNATGEYLRGFGQQIFSKITQNLAENTIGSLQSHIGLPDSVIGTQANPNFLGRILKGTPLDRDYGKEAKNPAFDANTTATATNTTATQDLTAAIKGMLPGSGSGGGGGYPAVSQSSSPGNAPTAAAIANSVQGLASSAANVSQAVSSGSAGKLFGGLGSLFKRGGGDDLTRSLTMAPASSLLQPAGGDGASAAPYTGADSSWDSILGSLGLKPDSDPSVFGGASNTNSIFSMGGPNGGSGPSISATGPTDTVGNDIGALSKFGTNMGGMLSGMGQGATGSGWDVLTQGGTPIKDSNGNTIGWQSATGMQQIGAGIGMAGTAAGGIYTAVNQFSKGGARGDIGGVGSIMGTAAALDPEPFSKAILGIGAMVSGLISSLLPDPRQQRIDQEQRRMLNAQYIKPSEHQYSFSATGNGGFAGLEGGGMQTGTGTSSVNNHYWVVPGGLTAQDMFEQMKKDPQGLSDTILAGITSGSANSVLSIMNYASQYGGS